MQVKGRREIALQGVAGWLMRHLRRSSEATQRMTLVQRIALGPRQSLALIEADGQRFLVATSAEAGAHFLPLDGRARQSSTARVSW